MSWEVIVYGGGIGLIVITGILWALFQWARGIGEKEGRADAFELLEEREDEAVEKRQDAREEQLENTLSRNKQLLERRLKLDYPGREQARRELQEAKDAWESDDT